MKIKTIRPLKDGVIADFDASEKMISMFIKSIPALKKKMFTLEWWFVSLRDYRWRREP
jgi:actin-like ATPase involved in cell morphogenesis